jgi:hypothetical protein
VSGAEAGLAAAAVPGTASTAAADSAMSNFLNMNPPP